MKGERIAEWLLSRITTPARAAAQTGDLLEIARTRGALWFWCAVLGNVVHGGFRFMLAFAGAFAFSQTMALLWAHGSLGNEPDRNSVYTAGTLILAPLCTVPVFLLLRFGWRDPHARFSLLFAGLAAVSFIGCPHPVFRWILPPVAVFAMASILTKGRRRDWIPLQSLAQVSSAVAVSLGGFALLLLALVSLWTVLCWWLKLPAAFFHLTVTLISHPVIDLMNALICLFIVRLADRLRGEWMVSRVV